MIVDRSIDIQTAVWSEFGEKLKIILNNSMLMSFYTSMSSKGQGREEKSDGGKKYIPDWKNVSQ